jgi:putative serine protease PepD
MATSFVFPRFGLRRFGLAVAPMLIAASGVAAPPPSPRGGQSEAQNTQNVQNEPKSPLPRVADLSGIPTGAGEAKPAAKTSLSSRRGLVILEQGAKAVASGVVLDGDGRVVTGFRLNPDPNAAAKSAELMIRYGDGSRARGKIMHSDATYGLALVVPLEGKRIEGLRASETDSSRALLHVMDASAPKPALVEAFSGRYLLPAPIAGLLTLAEPTRTPAGTALLDDSGGVAGLTVRVCGQAPLPAATSAGPAWAPVSCDIHAVAPVAAIRGFLAHAPASAVAPPPWLGIVGQPTDSGVRGVRVVAVANGSPAAVAGLRGHSEPLKADIINAVDGEPVSTPEELGERIGKHAAGDQVKLLVLAGKSFREVTVTLRAAP